MGSSNMSLSSIRGRKRETDKQRQRQKTHRETCTDTDRPRRTETDRERGGCVQQTLTDVQRAATVSTVISLTPASVPTVRPRCPWMTTAATLADVQVRSLFLSFFFFFCREITVIRSIILSLLPFASFSFSILRGVFLTVSIS